MVTMLRMSTASLPKRVAGRFWSWLARLKLGHAPASGRAFR